MKASWYAEALYGALINTSMAKPRASLLENESDSKKVIAHFHKVLEKRGHEKLLHFVMRELEKILTREKIKNEATLVTADGTSQGKWAHAYDHYEKEGIIPKRATRRDVVDETIIGGFQIRMKGTLIDGSYKKSLVELYRKITN